MKKLFALLLVVWPGFSGFSMLFSLLAASPVQVLGNYWEEPLGATENTCILLPFDEGAGTAFYGRTQSSPYAFSGSFRFADSAVWTSAVHSTGLAFNGATNQGVLVAQNGELDLTAENASWEFWIYVDEITGNDQVVAQLDRAWQIKIRPDGRIAMVAKHGSVWQSVNTESALGTGIWTHIIFTRACTNEAGGVADYNYTVYVNGEPAGMESYEGITVPPDSSANMTIGISYWNTQPLSGAVDDFRISDGIIRQQVSITKIDNMIVHNPGMGWHYNTDPIKFTNIEATEDLPPDEFDIVMLEWGWGNIEEQPGVYDWTELDAAVDRAKTKGLEVYLKLHMVACPDGTVGGDDDILGIPDWLWESPYNVPYVDVDDGSTVYATRHPCYWNTNYQQRASLFYQAFADHYSRDDIQVFNVKLYGNTGEWDAGNNAFPWEDFPTVSKADTLADLMNIPIAIFTNGCPQLEVTMAVSAYETNSIDWSIETAFDLAFEAGFFIRHAAFPYPLSTNILAVTRHWVWDTFYGDLVFTGEGAHGWQYDATPGYDLMQLVNTFLEWGRLNIGSGPKRYNYQDFLNTTNGNYEAYERGMLNFGYRLVPVDAVYSPVIQRDSVFSITIGWENHAVSRVPYDDYSFQACLKNSSGTIVWKRTDSGFDPTEFINGNDFDRDHPDDWFVGGNRYTIQHALARIPATQNPGTYDLYIAIVDDETGDPVIEMPLDGNDGNKRYKIGTVTVLE